MNFGFSIPGLLKGRKVTTSVWDRKTCVRLSADEREKMREIVDTFGCNSAQAQGLSRPATDYNRLKSSDHRLYLICKPHWVRGTRVIGGIKCGRKHLYFQKDDGYEECEPMCVLDFYVHERYQQKGIGRKLFRAFLESEGEQADTVAFSKPTPKLLGFIRKHYGRIQLISTRYARRSSSVPCSSSGRSRSVQQNNNFMVFETFLEKVQLMRVETSSDKRSGYMSRMSSGLHLRSPNAATISETSSYCSTRGIQLSEEPSPQKKSSRQSSTTVSSNIISRYSGMKSRKRASTSSVDSAGNPREPFSLHTVRPPLRPVPKKPMHPTTPHVSAPARIVTGPYPGWQPLEHGPRNERRKKKENAGLTRLAPIHSLTRQEPPTPACRCVPPWATGLTADRASGIVKKIATVSAMNAARHHHQQQQKQNVSATVNSARQYYKLYKDRSTDAAGARSSLQWNC